MARNKTPAPKKAPESSPLAPSGAPPPPIPIEERRSTDRVPTRMVVRFDSSPAFVKAYTGYASNIGAGGLCLITRREYRVGDPLRLELNVEKQAPVQLSGVVAWVRPGAAIGVRFENMTEEQRKAVMALVRLAAEASSST